MAQKPPANIDKTKFSQMKAGEYEIHVLVEATSNLALVDCSSIDAMISITAFGNKEYSKVKKDIGFEEVFWGEHFFISKNFETSEQAQGQLLLIEVWNHNKILKNSLVGSYEIDIKRIYSEKNHCMEHIWLAFSNVDVNFGDITGYVKISVALVGENDTNVELNVEKIESITKEKKVLMPPNISRVSYQLQVFIIEAKDVRPADGKTADPFIGVEFGQVFQKTDPVPKDLNPKFNVKLSIPLILPSITDNIALRLCDYNYIQNNEVLGSHYVNINELIDECSKKEGVCKHLTYHWVHFYGPPNDTQISEEKNVYQFFPQIASTYVGSLLIQFRMIKNQKPERKNMKLDPIPKIPKAPPASYLINAKIAAGLNLFQKNKKHRICIKVGSVQMLTNFVETKNGFCLWLVEKNALLTCEEDTKVPDVFVYLINDENIPTCFIRQPYTEKPEVLKNEWRSLQPDRSLVKFETEEAGYIKISLTITKRPSHQFYVQPPPDEVIRSNMLRAMQNQPRGRIIIELISAQSLLPLDEEGTSDPFFVFSYNLTEASSTCKPATLNPIYFQKVILAADVMKSVNDQFPIIVTAFDKDSNSRELIGSSFIDINDGVEKGSVVFGLNTKPKPCWYEVRNRNSISGRFLASFIIVEDGAVRIPPKIDIPFKKYKISLFILGLRNMKSNGIISVKRPYLEFDFESLNVYGQANIASGVSRNIKTEPKEEGPNINIKVSNSTVLNLPADVNYWPTLSGRVNDYVLGGVYEPILGFLSLDLKSSYLRSQKLLDDFLIKPLSPLIKMVISSRSQRLGTINPKLISNMRNFIVSCLNYNWRTVHPNLAINPASDHNKFYNPDMVVLLPNYVESEEGIYIEKYKDFIDKQEHYIKIGYDRKESRSKESKKRNKHYRFTLDSTYEQYYEKMHGMKMGVYDEVEVRKGRMHTGKDLMASITKVFSQTDSVVGSYKGNCFISEYKDSPTEEEERFFQKSKQFLQNFMSEIKIYMFIYILEAFDLPGKDLNGKSDPYLLIRIGDEEINLSSKSIDSTNNPQFNQLVKKVLVFPKSSSVEVEVWDHDDLNPDDFIGSAIIDVENRVLSQFGTFTTNNPIQIYRLRAKQSKLNQGSIRLWIDLVRPDELELYRQLDISSKSPSDFQVRIIVWSCEDVPCTDFEDMNDLYVICTFGGMTEQTDVHYRTSNGEGQFNWRMTFPIKLPLIDNTVSFRVYDKDFLTSNECICSGTFSIQEYLEQAEELERQVTLYLGEEDLGKIDGLPISGKQIQGRKMYDRFYMDLFGRKINSQTNVVIQEGRLQLSISILPVSVATAKPVGKGRSDPNQFPNLPEPKGRFAWSLNPFTMLNRLIGPRFRNKILCGLCVVILLFVLYNLLYSFGGSIIANIVTK